MEVKGPATEAALGDLHSKVATVMSRALDVTDKALEAYDLMDIEVIAEKGIKEPEISAPLLSVITRFLHENKITCAPAKDTVMGDLEQRLADKRARKKVGNVTFLQNESEKSTG
jgi:hypothetical protein